jgi:hypothetical protein
MMVTAIVVSLPFISFPFVWPPMWWFKKNKKQKNSMGFVEVIVNDYSKKNRNCHGLWWACLIVIIQSILVGGMRVKDGSKDQRPKTKRINWVFLTWWSHWWTTWPKN